MIRRGGGACGLTTASATNHRWVVLLGTRARTSSGRRGSRHSTSVPRTRRKENCGAAADDYSWPVLGLCQWQVRVPDAWKTPTRRRSTPCRHVPRQRLADVYGHSGPFLTVYLDVTRATENGEHEIEVQWSGVRAELTDAGADAATLDAVTAAVTADTGTPGRHGLMVVAAQGEICFTDVLRAGARAKRWHLVTASPAAALSRQLRTEVPHVVVVADRTGADIVALGPSGAQQQTVDGETTYPIRRTAADQWNERHFQNRVENSWQSNAQNVADVVAKQLASGPIKLVVVSGDIRARHLIRTPSATRRASASAP
jgi:hypothetical protein